MVTLVRSEGCDIIEFDFQVSSTIQMNIFMSLECVFLFFAYVHLLRRDIWTLLHKRADGEPQRVQQGELVLQNLRLVQARVRVVPFVGAEAGRTQTIIMKRNREEWQLICAEAHAQLSNQKSRTYTSAVLEVTKNACKNEFRFETLGYPESNVVFMMVLFDLQLCRVRRFFITCLVLSQKCILSHSIFFQAVLQIEAFIPSEEFIRFTISNYSKNLWQSMIL